MSRTKTKVGNKYFYHYEKKVYTVMIDNCTNYIKMNELSPQLIQLERDLDIMTIEIHVLAWDKQKKVLDFNSPKLD